MIRRWIIIHHYLSGLGRSRSCPGLPGGGPSPPGPPGPPGTTRTAGAAAGPHFLELRLLLVGEDFGELGVYVLLQLIQLLLLACG